MLNELALFSGIAGSALALEGYARPVAYCEIDPAAQAILLTRMAAGDIPRAPIWDDVCTLGIDDIPHEIDIITGGFPCQDISVAGHGVGLGGDRSGLFWQIIRLCGLFRPAFVFLENVPAITFRGGNEVVGAFAAMGYDCRWCHVSAASVGAPHKRDRWWLLANATGERLQGEWAGWQQKPQTHDREGIFMRHCQNPEWWATEPAMGRVAHGVPHRVDRIRGLGNAWVPIQARQAFETLIGFRIPKG